MLSWYKRHLNIEKCTSPQFIVREETLFKNSRVGLRRPPDSRQVRSRPPESDPGSPESDPGPQETDPGPPSVPSPKESDPGSPESDPGPPESDQDVRKAIPRHGEYIE